MDRESLFIQEEEMKNILLAIFLGAGSLWSNANLVTQTYTGTATDLKTGAVIYYEEHEATYDGEKHLRSKITYHDAKMNVIAEKNIELNGSAFATFRLEDFRYGTLEGAERTAKGIRLYERENASASMEEKVLQIPPPIAVDAGLNVLVRNNWDRLQGGEKVQFNLGVPSQLDYYGFRVVKDREEVFQGKRSLVVRFESDHWFIRLFVDPVIVWYDVETRRALNYEGISNIYNDQGKSYVVRVTFDKPGP